MTIYMMRRFPVALDPVNGAWLYPCAVTGCLRLTPQIYCCIWCEYFDRFYVRLGRHSIECEGRVIRHVGIFRLDKL